MVSVAVEVAIGNFNSIIIGIIKVVVPPVIVKIVGVIKVIIVDIVIKVVVEVVIVRIVIKVVVEVVIVRVVIVRVIIEVSKEIVVVVVPFQASSASSNENDLSPVWQLLISSFLIKWVVFLGVLLGVFEALLEIWIDYPGKS